MNNKKVKRIKKALVNLTLEADLSIQEKADCLQRLLTPNQIKLIEKEWINGRSKRLI